MANDVESVKCLDPSRHSFKVKYGVDEKSFRANSVSQKRVLSQLRLYFVYSWSANSPWLALVLFSSPEGVNDSRACIEKLGHMNKRETIPLNIINISYLPLMM